MVQLCKDTVGNGAGGVVDGESICRGGGGGGRGAVAWQCALDLSTQMPTVYEARAVLTLSMHCFSPPLLSSKSTLLIGQAEAPPEDGPICFECPNRRVTGFSHV